MVGDYLYPGLSRDTPSLPGLAIPVINWQESPQEMPRNLHKIAQILATSVGFCCNMAILEVVLGHPGISSA